MMAALVALLVPLAACSAPGPGDQPSEERPTGKPGRKMPILY